MMTYMCFRTLNGSLLPEEELFGPIVKIFYHLSLTYQSGTIIESWIPGQLLHFLYCRALEK